MISDRSFDFDNLLFLGIYTFRLFSLRKTVRKVSTILVTLTSRNDSNFERSHISSKKVNGMALIRTLMVSTTAFERTKENSMVFGRLFSYLGSVSVVQLKVIHVVI